MLIRESSERKEDSQTTLLPVHRHSLPTGQKGMFVYLPYGNLTILKKFPPKQETKIVSFFRALFSVTD